MSVRRSVRRSVRPSVRRSVGHTRVEILKKGSFETGIDKRVWWPLMYALIHPYFISIRRCVHPFVHLLVCLPHRSFSIMTQCKGFPYNSLTSRLAHSWLFLPIIAHYCITFQLCNYDVIQRISLQLAIIAQHCTWLFNIGQDCAILGRMAQY